MKQVRSLSCLILTAAFPLMMKAQTVEEVERTADKVGNTVNKLGGMFKKKNKEKDRETPAATNSNTTPASGSNKITINSKYSFTAGDTLLFSDNFESTETGRFPEQWKTDGSGEVVTIDEYPGKWFSISPKGLYIPRIKGGIMKDFTVEFDLIIANNNNSHTLFLDFEDALNGNFDLYPKNPFLQVRIYEGGSAWVDNKAKNVDSHVNSAAYNEGGKKNHIAIRKQGERLQVYINEEKTFDITNAFDAKLTYSTFKFGAQFNSPAAFLVSNVKIMGIAK